MLYTSEVRWFVPGAISRAITDWFALKGGAARTDQPEREDWYLIVPDCGHIGIKTRDSAGGSLELKVRDAVSEPQQLNANVAGAIETWHKLSLSSPQFGDHDEPRHDSAEWIPIKKQRSLYSVTRNGVTVNIELTAIARDRDDRCWTIGYEASGDFEHRRAILETVARDSTHDAPANVLLAENSYGYPEWLRRLRQLSL